MRIYIPDTEEILSVDEFIARKRGEGVSFPSEGYTAATFDGHGGYPLMEGPQPTPQAWQSVTIDRVEEDEGNYTLFYKLVPTFENQTEEDNYVLSWEAERLRAATPQSISDRQFFHALWKQNHITFEEAMAAVQTGTMPQTIVDFLAMLDQYDPEGANDARVLLAGATTFDRDHYLTPVFGSMYNLNNDQIDALWRFAASL